MVDIRLLLQRRLKDLNCGPEHPLKAILGSRQGSCPYTVYEFVSFLRDNQNHFIPRILQCHAFLMEDPDIERRMHGSEVSYFTSTLVCGDAIKEYAETDIESRIYEMRIQGETRRNKAPIPLYELTPKK